MEFGIEKCALLIMKSKKIKQRNGTAKSRKKTEYLERRKTTSTWKYWKGTPSNNQR